MARVYLAYPRSLRGTHVEESMRRFVAQRFPAYEIVSDDNDLVAIVDSCEKALVAVPFLDGMFASSIYDAALRAQGNGTPVYELIRDLPYDARKLSTLSEERRLTPRMTVAHLREESELYVAGRAIEF